VVLVTLLGTLWVGALVVVLALCRAAAVGDRVEDEAADLCGSPH
jgi:hypothetical protein